MLLVALLLAALTAVPQPALAANDADALKTTTVADSASGTDRQQDQAQTRTSTSKVGLAYRARVRDKGWQKTVKSTSAASAVAGLPGTRLRIEALKLKLTGMGTNTGSINYSIRSQSGKWQKARKDYALAGSKGKTIKPNGIKIWLSGDIAKHFDVYYRVKMTGKGWQGWKKNKAVAGTASKRVCIEAIQVKLSPKTEEAAGKGADRIGVRYDASVQDSGWQMWKGDGQTAGTTGKDKRLEAFNAVLSPGAYKGGITYQARVQGVGWQGGATWKKNGQTAGTTGKNKRVEAVRMKLTGAIAKDYDVYYRAYVAGYGWMGWAKNGAVSGSTGKKLRIEALQVKLRKKTQAAPSGAEFATVNKLMASRMNGIDIASWQKDLNVATIQADFVIVKTTGGKGYTNPYWKAQAKAAVNSGKMLGLYHYAQEEGYKGSAIQEADYFVKAVKSQGYVGRAVLFLDWEADALNRGPAWAKAFLDRVYKQTGVRPLIYTSKSVTNYYNWTAVAKDYKLWVAQYPDMKTQYGYLAEPWTDKSGFGAWASPTLFQYSGTGRLPGYARNLDLDLFYGTTNTWRALASKS